MSARRVRWLVSPIRGLFGWEVTRNGVFKRKFLFQYQAITWAASECNFDWETYGIKAELLIRGRNGQYRDARTYGEDPPEVLG
jgi:hypothetical protein